MRQIYTNHSIFESTNLIENEEVIHMLFTLHFLARSLDNERKNSKANLDSIVVRTCKPQKDGTKVVYTFPKIETEECLNPDQCCLRDQHIIELTLDKNGNLVRLEVQGEHVQKRIAEAYLEITKTCTVKSFDQHSEEIAVETLVQQ